MKASPVLGFFEGTELKWGKSGTNGQHIVVTARGKGEYSENGEMKSYLCANTCIFACNYWYSLSRSNLN